MALVVAQPPTLTAVAWQQSDDREATYDKLVAILSEAPSETCSLLSYEHDSEPEERLAAEAAGAPSRPTRPACAPLRICGTPAPRARPGAAARRALAAVCRVAGARPGLAALRRGPRAERRRGANCAGAALRYGDGAALAAALEIRARCGPAASPRLRRRWCGVALAAPPAATPGDDSHWDVALLNRLGAPCAEARALAADALARSRRSSPARAARGGAAAAAAPRSSVADLARRGPRARARRLRRRGRAAVRGGRRGGLRRGGRGAKRVRPAARLQRPRRRRHGPREDPLKCKTAVQRYAAHDDTAPGDAAAAACLGSFFGAWAAVYACMRASDAPRRAKFLKSQGAMIAKPYKACFAGVPGVREAVLVLLDVASALAVVSARARRGAAAAFQRVLDRDVDGAALDAARALALAPRADDDDGLFDAFVRAYGAPGPPGARDERAPRSSARASRPNCWSPRSPGPGASSRTCSSRSGPRRRAAGAPARRPRRCAWPALHAAIKDGAWLDASLSRQRLDELARLAADAASAVELLGELDARPPPGRGPDQRQRLRRRRGPRDAPRGRRGRRRAARGGPRRARVPRRRGRHAASRLADLAGPSPPRRRAGGGAGRRGPRRRGDAGALRRGAPGLGDAARRAAVAPTADAPVAGRWALARPSRLLAAAFGDDALAPVADAALRVVRGDLRLPAALTVALGAFRRQRLARRRWRRARAPRAPEPPRAVAGGEAAVAGAAAAGVAEAPQVRRARQGQAARRRRVVQSRSAAGPTTTKKKHDDEGRLRAARALESQHRVAEPGLGAAEARACSATRASRAPRAPTCPAPGPPSSTRPAAVARDA
ncbi:hypothetical protein JL720_3119 [Aureococcus anophagefferens]|nr:hypothetical protein JL720_3119 [Aureococcus anophagefferens]